MGESLRSSCAGEFDPTLRLAGLSRQALCILGREYLLIGHLQDRVALPLIAAKLGAEAYVQFSIDEWMGASPIYSQRVQRAMGFAGTDVGTVFKNLQLDIGAPHQFLDFQFRLDGPEYGEFWLPHCGALLDVEPFGERSVKLMCHDIEDPTFDATAAATNPKMKVRPIHRPPRVPADRYPHCRWKVFIDDEGSEYQQHRNLPLVASSKLASVDVLEDACADLEAGGWDDYAGAFDPGFQLEDLSHRALHTCLQEFAVQTHLLARSLLLNLAQQCDEATATAVGMRQWIGIGALAAQRIKKAMGIEGDDAAAIAKVLNLHPHFHPRTYVDWSVALPRPGVARVAIRPCPVLDEGDVYSWFATLGEDEHPALNAIVGAINPKARCVPTATENGESLAWNVVIEASEEPRPEPSEVGLARLSRGATFALEQRRPLRSSNV